MGQTGVTVQTRVSPKILVPAVAAPQPGDAEQTPLSPYHQARLLPERRCAVELDRAGTGRRGQHSTCDTGTATVDELAETLSALARDWEGKDDAKAVLAAIIAAGVAIVPGADGGSISVVHGRRRVISEAPTSDLAWQVDAIQEEVQQGPCLDAVYVQQTVRVDDLSTEQRWPLFATRAAETGAASMLALQLYVEGDNLGALNLYSRTPAAFTDESEQIGLLVAAHAAIAYIGVRKETHLAQALIHRDLIGQAKGILSERYQITGERAFLLLTRISQNSNRKLHQVALELVHSGTITGAHGLPPVPR